MIEDALRRRIQPIVKRRMSLYLAKRLAIYWLAAAVLGLALIGANRLWGWAPPAAVLLLCVGAVAATVVTFYRTRRMQPDYKAAARNIERQHPEARALVLAAIEQEPEGPDGRLGYLQESVIGEALRHGAKHDWLRSVPRRKLMIAKCSQVASLLLLLLVLSRTAPPAVYVLAGKGPPARKGYTITVTPGDTSTELGAHVVVFARFDELVPPQVDLLYGPVGEEPQKIVLSKNLEDPVFGGIIPPVNRELLYHIEYAGKRTGDYRISIYEHPALTRADARIVYPEFTSLPEKVIRDTRRVSAVEGSQIDLTFILNKAVTKAKLVGKEGAPLNLTVDSEHPNVYTTTITATEDRRYELHLADDRGLANKVPPRFAIDVHKNLPPELKPVFPNRDIMASPLEELSLEAEVSDDYGVIGYGLSYALAGTQSKNFTLGESVQADQKQLIQYLLAMEELQAQPDQLLTYSFWADDIGGGGTTRRTFSDMYFAEVRHFEEIFRQSQSSQSQQRRNQQQQGNQQGQRQDQLAQEQKQIILATWNIKRQTDQAGDVQEQHKNDIEVVRQSQTDVLEKAQSALGEARDPAAAEALTKAAKHMQQTLEHLGEAIKSASATGLTPALGTEQLAYQELLKLRRRDSQVARGQSSSRSSRSGGAAARSQQQLQQLELRDRQDRYETERPAQSQEQAQQREDLQVLNRLRELARRQNEMSEKLKELEAALRQAETEQQKQEIRRQLKRLREEQLEALRDVDELQQRMESPQNRRRMADAAEQLSDSRSRIRQSAEELEQGMVSRAVTSTTRAGRELEEMRDEFRRRTSGQFNDRMRQMREQAQQLDERQTEIADQIQGQLDQRQKTLVDSGDSRELAYRIDQQKKDAEELIEQMKEVSEQSETSEPLLSKKLYDTVRQAGTSNVDRSLEATSQLLRRNFLRQAQEVERPANRGIEQIRKGVEEAAESVLGDEAESLRAAQRRLDELIRQVDEEARRARGASRGQGDANEPADSAANQQRRADAQGQASGQRSGDPNESTRADAQRGAGGRRPGSQDPNQPRQNRTTANSGRQGNQPSDSERQGGRQQGSPRDGSRRQANNAGRNRPGGQERNDPAGWGGGLRLPNQWGGISERGPITGEDFRDWSDGLREVEEMLEEPDLRNEVARVRDRARSMRVEFKRHGTEPQWDLVTMQITKPLNALRQRIAEELAKLESNDAMVPIDRDPVPSRYAELVRKYYENLGGGD
ncbi:MAG: hypothetical protein JSW59_18085 [Phycisphaerales bacterium]|nr:MAG: hypothetical protein JSW59_18085 [Phycisphaerales bacterium]